VGPRDLPIGVAGSPQATAAIQRQLAQRGDAFDVHVYTDEAAARAAIADREVYGAIVAGPGGVTLLTASAASPVVAQLLTQATTEAGAQAAPGSSAAGGQPRVVDVVPADPDDPRGAALSASVLPLVLAGVLTAALIGVARRPGLGQADALLVAAPLAVLAAWAGLGLAAVWAGVLRRRPAAATAVVRPLSPGSQGGSSAAS